MSKLAVTAGLVVALAANAQAPPGPQPAELVLRGGAVFTADAANPTATAVAVRGGLIVYVGDDGGVGALVGATTRTIDIGGGMLLPGLHDSHVHIAAGGLGLATCDLSSDDTAEAVMTYRGAHREGAAHVHRRRAGVRARSRALTGFGAPNPSAKKVQPNRAVERFRQSLAYSPSRQPASQKSRGNERWRHGKASGSIAELS